MSRAPKPPASLRAARDSCDPSPQDRKRVREGLDRVLTGGTVSPTVLRVDASMAKRALGMPETGSLWASKAGVTKLLLPTLLLGAGLGALWSYDREEAHLSAETRADISLPLQVEDIAPVEQPAASEPHAVTAGAPAWASRAPVQTQKPPFHPHHRHAAAHKPSAHSAPPAQPQVEAEPPPEPVVAPAPVSHHLAEELRLMRAASAALTNNEPAKALRILYDHAQRFPDGALAEERRALRAIGLCKQRAPEARRELEAFLRSDAQSPLAARVRDACELPP